MSKECKNCIAKCTGSGKEGNGANCSYHKEGFLAGEDKCVICGAYVPEGSQVCMNCQDCPYNPANREY